MKVSGFDPRSFPVVDSGVTSAPIPHDALRAAALRQRFTQPLLWTPEIRQEPVFSSRPATAASVLVPLVTRASLTVLLTQRSGALSSHAGQVAFPGGKADAQDADVVATALREAHEEVALAPEQVEVLGCLPTYTTGSGFVVTPVVGLVRDDAAWRPNAGEVERIFEVPLAFLMNPANHRLHRAEWAGHVREWWSMPYDDGQMEHYIWGATAGMLRNLYRFLQAH